MVSESYSITITVFVYNSIIWSFLLPICVVKYRIFFKSRLMGSLQMFSLKGHVRKVCLSFTIFPSFDE